MSKPKINEDKVLSELSQSAFFRRPQPSDDPELQDRSVPNIDRPSPSSNELAIDRLPVRRSHHRTTRRASFECYVDQLETLKNLSLEEQLRGDKGNMSQMVREALDAYIDTRRKKKG